MEEDSKKEVESQEEEASEVVQPEVDQEAEPEESEVEEGPDPEVEARRQLTARAKKAEAEKKALEKKLRETKGEKPSLDVEDYIDISASLEGLDSREKEYLAKQHKLSGKPLSEIRKDEDFTLWQDAYRQKVEKEKTLKPSGTQGTSDAPKSIGEQISVADMAGKEELLRKYGLYKDPRPRTDHQSIGK